MVLERRAHRRTLGHAVRQKGRELDVLRRISETISCTLDQEEVLRHIIDLVVEVTVCDDAAKNCPVWLPAPVTQEEGGQAKRVHLGFPDPAEAIGSEEEVMAVFRAVRDAIAEQVPTLLCKWTSGRPE